MSSCTWKRDSGSEADRLRAAGHEVVLDDDLASFGGGQAILADGEALVGGTDPRKDGYAAGY